MTNKLIFPSKLAEAILRLPDGSPFRFKDRVWLRRVFDDPARSKLLKAGRQIGKTSTLGAILALKSLEPFHTALYIAPRERQARDFSKDKLNKIISSPWYRDYMTSERAADNTGLYVKQVHDVLDKIFANGAQIKLRYSFRSPDAIRGVTAKTILLDEVQDLMSGHIPIIMECQSSFSWREKNTLYAGTPKTFGSALEEKWNLSTAHEWFLRCDGCRKWQFILRENIADDTKCTNPDCDGHIICRRCGRLLNPTNGQWIPTRNHESQIIGFRLPQVLNPVIDYHSENGIIAKANEYSDQIFHNEVLGLPHDLANRVFDMEQVRSLCNPNLSMSAYRYISDHIDVFAGLDYGEGGTSKTVLTIGYWTTSGVFKVLFAQIFDDRDSEAELKQIINIVRRWDCRVIGCDVGAGRYRNKILIKQLMGKCMVLQCHYPSNISDHSPKVRFNRKSGMVTLHRHKTLDDVVMTIKEGRAEFPRLEQFAPFLRHLEFIREDYNSRSRQVYFDHPSNHCDDFFHSANYCQIAGKLWRGELCEAA